LRYVDDFMILSDDKRWLHRLVPRIEAKLLELGLQLACTYREGKTDLDHVRARFNR